MYLDIQYQDGGMRPLPPEEAEGEEPQRFRENKKSRPKERTNNVDVRHLTRRIESFAENNTGSDSDALKLIEDTRGTILKLRLIKKNKRNKGNGRH